MTLHHMHHTRLVRWASQLRSSNGLFKEEKQHKRAYIPPMSVSCAIYTYTCTVAFVIITHDIHDVRYIIKSSHPRRFFAFPMFIVKDVHVTSPMARLHHFATSSSPSHTSPRYRRMSPLPGYGVGFFFQRFLVPSSIAHICSPFCAVDSNASGETQLSEVSAKPDADTLLTVFCPLS